MLILSLNGAPELEAVCNGTRIIKKTSAFGSIAGRPLISTIPFRSEDAPSFAQAAVRCHYLGLSIVLAALRRISSSICGVAVDAMPSSNLQLSEYQKQDWQVEDGLPENDVRMIAQRPDGTLLLASSSGIASFDGQHFRALPINDPAKAAGDQRHRGSERHPACGKR
jgi:hypothetical protein